MLCHVHTFQLAIFNPELRISFTCVKKYVNWCKIIFFLTDETLKTLEVVFGTNSNLDFCAEKAKQKAKIFFQKKKRVSLVENRSNSLLAELNSFSPVCVDQN